MSRSKDLINKLTSLDEMAHLYSKNTGVEGVVIWISTKGNAKHGCRIKIKKGQKSTGFDFDFSLTIPDHNIIGKLSVDGSTLNLIKEYAIKNQDLLLKLWGKEIDFIDYAVNQVKV